MDQVLAEMQRRDIAADLREAREDRKRQKWAALRTERRSVVESEFINAEAATNGYMLNRRGVEAGVDPAHVVYGARGAGPQVRERRSARLLAGPSPDRPARCLRAMTHDWLATARSTRCAGGSPARNSIGATSTSACNGKLSTDRRQHDKRGRG